MPITLDGTLGITTPSETNTGTLSVTGVTTLTGGLNAALPVLSGGTGVTTSTGSGANVLGTSPTLTTPALGTPASGILTSCTGLNYDGFKNRIINGGMVIDQRNAGASVTPTNGQFSVDRFILTMTQTSKFTTQQNAAAVTPPVGFLNYLGITSSSAYSVLTGDTFLVIQNIEGFNTSDLDFGKASAATVTLSFRVYSSLTGTFGGALANSAANRSYPFSYSIPTANTWTTISVTIAGDTSGTWVGATNGVGLIVRFGLGSGATYSGTAGAWAAGNLVQPTGSVSVVGTNGATFYITGVQLEKGATATSFNYRPYGTELALCQRYFETSYNAGTAVGSTGIVGSTTSLPSPYAVGFTFIFKVSKRTTPTMVGYSTFNGATGNASVNNTSNVALAGFLSEGCASAFAYETTNISNSVFYIHWTATAEL